jgi:hypothetical protein
LGTVLQHQARYACLSSLFVEKVTDQGEWVVRQKVEAVRLQEAGDDLLGQQLKLLLQKTQGATFRFRVRPTGEVLQFVADRPVAPAQVAQLTPTEMTLLTQSVLDQDGWQELAQLTFFRPPDSSSPGGHWQRPLKHGWGSLGGWTGRVHYASQGKVSGKDCFQYRLDLVHVPPPQIGTLPVQIQNPSFRLQLSGGHIEFDKHQNRVTLAEEHFHVQGSLGLTALGIATILELEELQVFQMRILDHLPTNGWNPGGSP